MSRADLLKSSGAFTLLALAGCGGGSSLVAPSGTGTSAQTTLRQTAGEVQLIQNSTGKVLMDFKIVSPTQAVLRGPDGLALNLPTTAFAAAPTSIGRFSVSASGGAARVMSGGVSASNVTLTQGTMTGSWYGQPFTQSFQQGASGLIPLAGTCVIDQENYAAACAALALACLTAETGIGLAAVVLAAAAVATASQTMQNDCGDSKQVAK